MQGWQVSFRLVTELQMPPTPTLVAIRTLSYHVAVEVRRCGYECVCNAIG